MREAVSEIFFDVPGLPPIKNEAKSMLAAGHAHADRVRTLLLSTHAAVRRTGWSITPADVALELVVRGPGRPPGDATNFLGGVGDVLQDKAIAHNIDLTHLGELRAVALYGNDVQISEVTYRLELAEQWSYSVRVALLEQPSSASAERRSE